MGVRGIRWQRKSWRKEKKTRLKQREGASFCRRCKASSTRMAMSRAWQKWMADGEAILRALQTCVRDAMTWAENVRIDNGKDNSIEADTTLKRFSTRLDQGT